MFSMANEQLSNCVSLDLDVVSPVRPNGSYNCFVDEHFVQLELNEWEAEKIKCTSENFCHCDKLRLIFRCLKNMYAI